jgi:hypothetical protein
MNLTNLKILFILVILNFHSDIFPQVFSPKNIFKDFYFSASLTYVSSASIQLNPKSPDLVEKNMISELTNGGYGYGFSVKRRIFNDDIFIGVSTEYIKITDDQLSTLLENDFDYEKVRVTETVEMIPVELSVYFNIPRIIDNLNVYLGGGGGFYFGDRTRKMVQMETETVSKSPLFSLNVLFGAEYLLDEHFTLNLEMKVRDGKYRVQSRFPTNNVTLDGQTYYFTQDFESKIFIDGLKMSFGIGYHF